MQQAQLDRAIVSIRTRIAAHALLLRTFRSLDGDGVIAFAKAMDVACRRYSPEKPDDQPLFSEAVRRFNPEFEGDWEDTVDEQIDLYHFMLERLEHRPNRSEIDIALLWNEEEPEIDLISRFSL